MKTKIIVKILSSFSKGLFVILLVLIFGLILVWKNIASQQIKITNTNSEKIIKLTPTPNRTLIPTLAPTIALTPIPTPIPTLTPVYSPTPAPIKNTSVNDYILGKVNEYRRSQGLSEVKENSETCSFAAKRAQEASVNFNHDGFKNYPYPKYSRVTENLAMNTNFADVVNEWINSPAHADIMRQDTPYVCIQNYGDYYAYEGWKP